VKLQPDFFRRFGSLNIGNPKNGERNPGTGPGGAGRAGRRDQYVSQAPPSFWIVTLTRGSLDAPEYPQTIPPFSVVSQTTLGNA
jgi:hypothetical protein